MKNLFSLVILTAFSIAMAGASIIWAAVYGSISFEQVSLFAAGAAVGFLVYRQYQAEKRIEMLENKLSGEKKDENEE